MGALIRAMGATGVPRHAPKVPSPRFREPTSSIFVSSTAGATLPCPPAPFASFSAGDFLRSDRHRRRSSLAQSGQRDIFYCPTTLRVRCIIDRRRHASRRFDGSKIRALVSHFYIQRDFREKSRGLTIVIFNYF